jgi:MarR family transcriptional regulator, 2-MHQ and catechol-resistance regulon repressor
MPGPALVEDPKPVTALQLWTVLSRCYEATLKFVEQTIATENLGFSDFMVLEVLLHKGPLPISVIGQKILRTNASMTSAIDRLQEKALVRRRADREDRRVLRIELTAKGEELIQHVFRRHERQMDELMSEVTQEERHALYAGMKKLGFAAQARNSSNKK